MKNILYFAGCNLKFLMQSIYIVYDNIGLPGIISVKPTLYQSLGEYKWTKLLKLIILPRYLKMEEV